MLSNEEKKNCYNTPTGYSDYEEYRSYDTRACEIVNDYLDENLYPLFCDSDRITSFSQQIHGIDCTFTDYAGFNYICDEKAAVKWSNKNLKTQALELKYVNRAGNIHRGWFLDESHENNCYNFIYTDKITNDEGDFDYKNFTPEDIKQVECYIVRKVKLQEYFNAIGWPTDKLIEKCREIRRTNGKCDMCDLTTDGLRFHFSKNLPEKPINVLISRNTLQDLSDYIFKKKGKNFIFACKKK